MTIIEVMKALANKYGYEVEIHDPYNFWLYIKNHHNDYLRFKVINQTIIKPDSRRSTGIPGPRTQARAIRHSAFPEWENLGTFTSTDPIDLTHPNSISKLEKIIEDEFFDLSKLSNKEPI